MNSIPFPSYTAVVTLGGGYGVVLETYEQGRVYYENVFSDLEVARSIALIFAQIKAIRYDSYIQIPNQSIVTVIQIESAWYPICVNPDHIVYPNEAIEKQLDGTQEKAIKIAKEIALFYKIDFVTLHVPQSLIH